VQIEQLETAGGNDRLQQRSVVASKVTRLEVKASVQCRHRRHEQRERAAGTHELPGGLELVDVVANVLEHADVDDRVEGTLFVCAQEITGGDLAGVDPRSAGGAALQLGKDILGRLDRDDLVAQFSQLGGDGAHPSAHLQHPVAEVWCKRLADPIEKVIGVRQVSEFLGGAKHRLTRGGLRAKARVSLRPQRLVAAHLAANAVHVTAHGREAGGELA